MYIKVKELQQCEGKMDFTFQKYGNLTIAQVETSKDKIEQPDLATDEKMFIPPLGSSMIMSGKSGSGKSTLLANFIKDGRFYGKSEQKPNGWFDKIFLFSPTANGDDIQRSLGIPSNHVFTNLDEAPALLEVILNTQQQKIDKSTADEVPQYAVIFDDVIGDLNFMNCREFTRCFYQVRHVNCTIFMCTQHFKRVPRVCRLQANFVFFFQGSANEVETIVDDFAPPMYSKNEFRNLVNESTKEKYSFLTINMKTGWNYRFRKNLDEFINLPRLTSDYGVKEQSKKKRKRDDDTNKHLNEGKNSKIYDSDNNREDAEVLDTVFEHYAENGTNEQTPDQ